MICTTMRWWIFLNKFPRFFQCVILVNSDESTIFIDFCPSAVSLPLKWIDERNLKIIFVRITFSFPFTIKIVRRRVRKNESTYAVSFAFSSAITDGLTPCTEWSTRLASIGAMEPKVMKLKLKKYPDKFFYSHNFCGFPQLEIITKCIDTAAIW